MNRNGKMALGIEAAIAGGSLSLIDDIGIEIANWVGSSDVSRAEDLLVNVDLMLTANGCSIRDLGLIAASAGPGSFTGTRIGISTALGMATGLNISMSSVSALQAMASEFLGNELLVTAVPVGRGSVCYQSFKTKSTIMAISDPRVVDESSFWDLSSNFAVSKFVLHSSLFGRAECPEGLEDFGDNVAKSVARLCVSDELQLREPMFISKQV